MIETVKLYEGDSHLRSFSATVLECNNVDNYYEIILDQTAFFPEGGGQSADTGKIGEAHVFDAQISGGIIRHMTDKPLDIGKEYACEINWEQRFRRMQNHSGEHIVSGLIHKHFGFDNIGFHMGHEDITLDINGILTEDDIRRIEYLANLAVAENARIICEYPDPSVLALLEYRSKLELNENVRIVTIEGYDACACCAPHVSRTGEIGIIKLLDHAKNKGGTRIHMLCGIDALSDYDERYHMIAKAAQSLSVKQSALGDALIRLEEEIAELKQKNYALRTELSEYKIAEIKPTDGNICIFEDEATPNDMRRLMNAGLEKCGGICAVFCGTDERGYTFTAASKSIKLREIAADMRTKLNTKGGGSDEMIQGSVLASKEKIKEYFGA
ncbi:MAG: hypothetical protein IJZ89_07365 [Clostridia bacterium]|nr:hypothetical protein [Clostridia bacterium]